MTKGRFRLMRSMALATGLMTVATLARAQSSTPRSRPPVPGAPTGVTAFVDVTVIPMDSERTLPHHTVLVRDGRIAALGPIGALAVPQGAVRIEGQGRYLMPGFGACHGHVTSLAMGWLPRGNQDRDPRYAALNLFRLFANGITVLRNADYMDPQTHASFRLTGPELLQLRANAGAGTIWSPRIYTTGQWAPKQYILSGDPKWQQRQATSDTSDTSPRAWPLPRMDSVAAYVAAFKAAGYDYLKLHEESPEVADSALAAARRIGLQVGGHVIGTLDRALAGGQRVTDHTGALGGWPVWSGATATAEAYRRQLAAEAGARRRAGMWACIGGYFPHDSLMLRTAVDSGVGMLLGTDGWSGNFDLPSFVREAKLTPYQALATGTKNYGQYLRTLDPHGDETGTIAVGQRADLVLLTGNPLVDIRYANPSEESDSTRTNPALVMVGGRWLARPELNRRLAVVKQYADLLGVTEALTRDILVDSSLISRQRAALLQVDSVSQVRQLDLVERFALTQQVPAGGADSLRGAELLVDLFARQLGAIRAALPAAAQGRFDVPARAWLAARAADGYPITISGVTP